VVYTSEYPFVYATADVVAFGIRPDTGLSVLLVKRGSPPYRGRWAFPGGFVDEREDLEPAARRELREETGVSGDRLRLEQLGAYGAPRRDPRHRVISVAYLAVLAPDVAAVAGDDAAAVGWLPVAELLGSRRLAFDHGRILADAVERLRERLESTSLATAFLAETFTIGELRRVYELVWDQHLDPGNFQRRVTGASGFVSPTGDHLPSARGRPAALFRAGPVAAVRPPLLRDPGS
jgi:8-oxo-dGTP diphosphatase